MGEAEYVKVLQGAQLCQWVVEKWTMVRDVREAESLIYILKNVHWGKICTFCKVFWQVKREATGSAAYQFLKLIIRHQIKLEESNRALFKAQKWLCFILCESQLSLIIRSAKYQVIVFDMNWCHFLQNWACYQLTFGNRLSWLLLNISKFERTLLSSSSLIKYLSYVANQTYPSFFWSFLFKSNGFLSNLPTITVL